MVGRGPQTAVKFFLISLALGAAQVRAQSTETYEYDALGRLKRVERSGNGNDGQYIYDAAGNRVKVLHGVSFSVDDVSVSEGGNLVFTITKTGMTSQTHDVDYATANNTAAAGSDYTTKSGTLSFTAAQTEKTVSVATSEDASYENNETLYLNLSSATNGAVIADGQGVGTINDDDAGPAFSVNNVSVSEGGNLVFTVTKSGATSKSHNVNYATANGTASSNDYTSKSGALTFTSSQTSKTVSVSTIEDSNTEPNETVKLNLSNATNGATISDSQGIGTINNDDTNSPPVFVGDAPITIQAGSSGSRDVLANDYDPDGDPLSITSYSVQPGGLPVNCCFWVSGTIAGNYSISYTISDGNGGTTQGYLTVDVQGGGGGGCGGFCGFALPPGEEDGATQLQTEPAPTDPDGAADEQPPPQ